MQAKLSVFYTVHAHKYTSTHVQSPVIWNSRLPSSLQCIVGTGLTNRCVTSVLPCISLHSWDLSEYRFVLFHGSGKRQLSSNCLVCVFQHIGLLQACIHRCTVCVYGRGNVSPLFGLMGKWVAEKRWALFIRLQPGMHMHLCVWVCVYVLLCPSA